jgi:hypothetical protein
MRLRLQYCKSFYCFWETSKAVHILWALLPTCSYQNYKHSPIPPPPQKHATRNRPNEENQRSGSLATYSVGTLFESRSLHNMLAKFSHDFSHKWISEWNTQTTHNYLPSNPILLTFPFIRSLVRSVAKTALLNNICVHDTNACKWQELVSFYFYHWQWRDKLTALKSNTTHTQIRRAVGMGIHSHLMIQTQIT